MDCLVVIDMQKDFCPAPHITSYIKNFIINNYSSKYEIVATIDNHSPDNYYSHKEYDVYPLHCVYGTLGWEMVDDLRPLLYYNDEVTKFYKDTFASTEMASYIKNNSKEIESVTLMGVCTDICVLSNALLLRAEMPDVEIIVDAAGCMGSSPKAHKAALALMKANAITVINENKEEN